MNLIKIIENMIKLLENVQVEYDYCGSHIVCEDVDGKNWFDLRDEIMIEYVNNGDIDDEDGGDWE